MGLIFSDNNGIAAYHAPGGAEATRESILFETVATVTGSGTLNYDLPLTNLGANPQARGALILDGALFSKEPLMRPI